MPKIPKVYKVGNSPDDDYTPEEIELLTYRIRDWFLSEECDRNYNDPLEEARKQVEQCLLAQNGSGKMWKRCPERFEDRIRSRTLYDMDEGNHIAQERAKGVEAKQNAAHKKAVEEAKASSNISSPTTQNYLMKYQNDQESMILQAYPELDTPAHRPNVQRLAMLYAEQERIKLEMPTTKASARKNHIETLALLQKTITDTMKALDIYPDQIRKRMDDQRRSSIGDFVAMVEDDPEFKKREKLYSLTLALQLWWMTQHPNGKGDGPNIDEFEMWHLTRTRPIQYKCKCGHEATLVEGFTPDELKEYLIKNGVLVENPILPQLYSKEDLSGLQPETSDESDEDETDADEDGGSEITDDEELPNPFG